MRRKYEGTKEEMSLAAYRAIKIQATYGFAFILKIKTV